MAPSWRPMPSANNCSCAPAVLIVDLAKRHYEQDDNSVLPRSIATKAAFENAMALDVAMGGSTNTVLHLLAAAQEAEVHFTMEDIDRISRKVPCLCKVAPRPKYHIEDVHRAGGIVAILGELARAGLLNAGFGPCIADTGVTDTMGHRANASTEDRAAIVPRSTGRRAHHDRVFAIQAAFRDWIRTATQGCIRDKEHAYSQRWRAGRVVRQPAQKGCIVKTAGVDESIWYSRDRRACLKARMRRRSILAENRLQATWSSSAMKARRADLACRKCCTRLLPEIQGPGQGMRPVHRWPFLRWFLRPGTSATPRRKRPRGGAIGLVRRGRLHRYRYSCPQHQSAPHGRCLG